MGRDEREGGGAASPDLLRQLQMGRGGCAEGHWRAAGGRGEEGTDRRREKGKGGGMFIGFSSATVTARGPLLPQMAWRCDHRCVSLHAVGNNFDELSPFPFQATDDDGEKGMGRGEEKVEGRRKGGGVTQTATFGLAWELVSY